MDDVRNDGIYGSLVGQVFESYVDSTTEKFSCDMHDFVVATVVIIFNAKI